jgi:hypothetical protein
VGNLSQNSRYSFLVSLPPKSYIGITGCGFRFRENKPRSAIMFKLTENLIELVAACGFSIAAIGMLARIVASAATTAIQ